MKKRHEGFTNELSIRWEWGVLIAFCSLALISIHTPTFVLGYALGLLIMKFGRSADEE